MKSFACIFLFLTMVLPAMSGENRVPAEVISEILGVQYASVTEIANVITNLSKGDKSTLFRGAPVPNELRFPAQILVHPDLRSNKLLIFADPLDLKNLKELISKLDVPLPQILIEAAIFEITLDDSGRTGSRAPVSANFFGDLKQITNFVSTTSNQVVTQGFGFSYVAKLETSIAAAIAAVQSKPNISLIQKPRVLTTTGTRATIFVGALGTSATRQSGWGCGGLLSPNASATSDAGLDVTPFITPANQIKLELLSTANKIEGSTEIEGVGAVPNTFHLTAETSLTIQPGEVIMLGAPLFHPVKESPTSKRRQLVLLLIPTVVSN